MKFLTSLSIRIFIISWSIFAIHFATNIVREHYPAFSLVDYATFKVDEYQGFHPDIFVHTDGHSYIGNNVAASVIAAIPLFIFDPILDVLERYEKRKIRREGVPGTIYRTRHTNSIKFLKLVKEKGLSLRFGGASVVTSVFLMAPLSAMTIVFMFHLLTRRGIRTKQALWLSMLFGFGTPVFFRTGVINHNMLIMYAAFVAFYLLWIQPEMRFPVSMNRRLTAGFLCGACLALDYSGIIPLLVFYGYLIINRLSTASLKTAIRESIPFIIGCAPPVLFLCYSQWSMFGNPFLPGQYWMPNVTTTEGYYFRNPYSDSGFRGFTWPSLDLFYLNLFSPSYGMYTYGPILAIGLIPTCFYKKNKLILTQPERILTTIFFILFLSFCAANQYSRIQFNSGFRYLVPLIPLIYLSACDHLVRIPRRWLIIIVIPILLHSWVISMVREPVPESWCRVITEGLQLPWLSVLRATAPEGHPILGSSLLPTTIILLTMLLVFTIWKLGKTSALKRETDNR
ncbi:hypothetical protein [Candidatus Scalindua japonica]|uniref:hypothetical protein n=1 Tax=Candidatus Scalindua japonica TaxID=1284222 RepID=UPI000BDE7E49|nr:hypothetical protein [Candidatus Scalindua japonica]